MPIYTHILISYQSSHSKQHVWYRHVPMLRFRTVCGVGSCEGSWVDSYSDSSAQARKLLDACCQTPTADKPACFRYKTYTPNARATSLMGFLPWPAQGHSKGSKWAWKNSWKASSPCGDMSRPIFDLSSQLTESPGKRPQSEPLNPKP